MFGQPISMTTSGGRSLWLALAPILFLGLWSGGYVAAKFGLGYAEPMTFLTLRYASVLLIMLVLFMVIKPPLPRHRIDWIHLSIVGFLIQSLYFGMCYLAFRQGIAVGTLALIFSLQPIIVSLIAPVWSGESIKLRTWIGLVLGLTGAVVVIVARSNIELPSTLELLFATLALLGITGGSLWEKRFGLTHHPVTANLVGYTAGLLGVLPFMLLLESMQVQWTGGFILSLAYLTIGNSIIAIGLLLAMIRAGDVSKVSALFFLVPPLAALWAWIILGEVMPVTAWGGFVVAATGVWLATRK